MLYIANNIRQETTKIQQEDIKLRPPISCTLRSVLLVDQSRGKIKIGFHGLVAGADAGIVPPNRFQRNGDVLAGFHPQIQK